MPDLLPLGWLEGLSQDTTQRLDHLVLPIVGQV
jgi:hypothetical protein